MCGFTRPNRIKRSALSKVPFFCGRGLSGAFYAFNELRRSPQKTELRQANATNIYSAYDSND